MSAFLADPACNRVGIILPGAGALARLVTNALVRLDIRITTFWHIFCREFSRRLIGGRGFGFRKARESTRSSISLTLFSDRGELFPGLSLNAFERTLRSAYAEVLIDDLDILRRFCAQESGGTKEQVAAALGSISFLPRVLVFRNFLAQQNPRSIDSGGSRIGWRSRDEPAIGR